MKLVLSLFLLLFINACSSIQNKSINENIVTDLYDSYYLINDNSATIDLNFKETNYRYPYTLNRFYAIIAILKEDVLFKNIYSTHFITDDIDSYKFYLTFDNELSMHEVVEYIYSLFNYNLTLEDNLTNNKNDTFEFVFSRNPENRELNIKMSIYDLNLPDIVRY